MIVFQTEHLELYNYIVHGFLDADIYGDLDIDKDDIFDENTKQMIKAAARIEFDNQSDEKDFSVGEFEKGFYDVFYYPDLFFTDEECEKTLKFIRENIYTDTYQMYINISILDLRKRKAPSIK